MTGYAIGMLFGRLTASYLIVLSLLFISHRFKATTAVRKSTRWYSLLATGVLFTLGVAVSVAQNGVVFMSSSL